MSTSPCLPEYKFPVKSPKALPKGLGCVPFPEPAMTPKELDTNDYFGIKTSNPHTTRRNYLSPSKPSIRGQGSVSSLGSETTCVGSVSSFTAHDHSMSTDTLVEDFETIPMPDLSQKQVSGSGRSALHFPHRTKNHTTLNTQKVALAKKRSSVGSASGFARLSITKEEEPHEKQKPLSATEPRFNLDRKYSLGLIKETSPSESSPSPTLTKQYTSPMIATQSTASFFDLLKGQQTRRSTSLPPQDNYREQILSLSPSISIVSTETISRLLLESSVDPGLGLRNLLALDCRPLVDFLRCHISGAINICLPSTLLKRANFSLMRCVNSLPAYEQKLLSTYFHYNELNIQNNISFNNPHMGSHGLPGIILYDQSNNSANIYHMCKKILDASCFNAAAAPPIYILDTSFSVFTEKYPSLLASGACDLLDLDSLPIQLPAKEESSPKPHQAAKCELGLPLSRVQSSPVKSASSFTLAGSDLTTPSVSNFSLPLNLPEKKFRIRHNEEIFDFSSAMPVDENFATLSISTPEMEYLPNWLQESIANKKRLHSDFYKLEECEKLRLNCALKLQSSENFLTPDGSLEVTPIIHSGLDHGHKNRYKDIFLYEHSRVSLKHTSSLSILNNTGTKSSAPIACDYINASYLNSSSIINEKIWNAASAEDSRVLKSTNCIATQGPLPRTAGDFWKCVVNQGSLVIISLTSELENGIEKCYAYWKSGLYESGESVVDVCLEETEIYESITIRTLAVSVDGGPKHRVIQIHLDSWSDMGVAHNSEDIISMIHLKRYVLKSARTLPGYPAVIHCSAGCGRTGVFVAADILVNLMSLSYLRAKLTEDPVYDVVSDLRRQRISMVQTARQYSSIYGLLIKGVKEKDEVAGICGTNIAKKFVSSIG